MVIGLAGRIGAGKNTVGYILEQDFSFRQLAFATPLREEVADITLLQKRIPHDIISRADSGDTIMQELARLLCIAKHGHMNPWQKPTLPTMRLVLQLFGTEYRRSQDPNYWIKKAQENIRSGTNYVFTDTRFTNEVAICNSTWWISRPSADNEPVTHVSESLLKDDCDLTVYNHGSMADLKLAVSHALQIMTANKKIKHGIATEDYYDRT